MKKILVVDDNSLNLQLLGKLLSENGYNALIAKSVSQAIAIANTKYPDLIVTDIMMPEIDGLELCQILKSNTLTSKIPLMFVSATTDPAIIAKAARAGGVDFLSKPFDTTQLLNLVSKYSGNGEIQQVTKKPESSVRNFDPKKLKDTSLLDSLANDNNTVKKNAIKDFQSVAYRVEKKLEQVIKKQIPVSEVMIELHRLTNLCPYIANKFVIEEIRQFESLLRTNQEITNENYLQFISLLCCLSQELGEA